VLSWAHKYEELLEEFGVPRLSMKPNDSDEHVQEFLDLPCDEQRYQAIRDTLADRVERMKPQIVHMWDEVARILQPESST